MKVKDLKQLLNTIPDESNISLEGKEFHIEIKYYGYVEELDEEMRIVEEDYNYFLKHRERYPEKIRYRIAENDKRK